MQTIFFKCLLTIYFLVILAGTKTNFAFAQISFPDINPPLAGFSNLNDVISRAIPIVFIFGALTVLIFLFYGGLVYLTAGANEDNTKKARAIITNAIVGLFLVSATWACWLLIIGFVPGLSILIGQ